MNLLTKDYKTIDSDSVIDFMEQLKDFIVDNGPYYTSNIVKQKAVELGITMVYLPSYNANLNPIERL